MADSPDPLDQKGEMKWRLQRRARKFSEMFISYRWTRNTADRSRPETHLFQFERDGLGAMLLAAGDFGKGRRIRQVDPLPDQPGNLPEDDRHGQGLAVQFFMNGVRKTGLHQLQRGKIRKVHSFACCTGCCTREAGKFGEGD